MSVANLGETLTIDSWETLVNLLKREPIQTVLVKNLVLLTGGCNLTAKARVRVANELMSRGIAFGPKFVLTEKNHQEALTLYIYTADSQLAKVLQSVEEPSLKGLRYLQTVEDLLQTTTIRKQRVSKNFVKSERYYL